MANPADNQHNHNQRKRHGLLAQMVVFRELEDAKEHTLVTKTVITFIVAVAGTAAPVATLDDIAHEFQCSSTVVNLSVALYMLSTGIFPLWWSHFSEQWGRRSIYLVSFGLFVLWNGLSGAATSFAMFIVMRILSGGASASVQAVGAGTIADLWEVRHRGRAMGVFYIGPLCGPLLGPIVGGALGQGLGWRSTQWFLTIYGGVVLLAMVFLLPETHKTSTSTGDPSEKEKNQAWIPQLQRAWHGLVDPLKILLYLRYPVVILLVYYASWSFGCLYFLNISIQHAFAASPYNYSTIIVGLLYIPSSLGYVVASVAGGRWIDYIMRREARKANRYDDTGRLIFRPEDRMKENAAIAAVLYPAALIWYGWTVEYHIVWIVPMIANFFFGVGSMLIFSMVTTMLTEYLPNKSSHGVAVNNFLRNTFACVATIVTMPLINAIGQEWLFTGLTVISLASGIGVILSMRWLLKQGGVNMSTRL